MAQDHHARGIKPDGVEITLPPRRGQFALASIQAALGGKLGDRDTHQATLR
jgi:hypothetical protein